MNEFFVIKLIKPNGERGYLVESPNGILISVGAVTSDIKQFSTSNEAEQYIRKNKLERQGVRALIRTNQDIIKDAGTKVLEHDVFYLENERGEKLFYDSGQQGYYFDNRDAGYCCWKTRDDLLKFCEAYDLEDGIIKKMVAKNGK